MKGRERGVSAAQRERALVECSNGSKKARAGLFTTIAISTVNVREWRGSGRARSVVGMIPGVSVNGVRDGGWVLGVGCWVLLARPKNEVGGQDAALGPLHPCPGPASLSNTLPHQTPSHPEDLQLALGSIE